MCIRDRHLPAVGAEPRQGLMLALAADHAGAHPIRDELAELCLLYTSDAADERSSVDLGGRRIIKKKK